MKQTKKTLSPQRRGRKKLAKRLKKYGLAAVSVATTGMAISSADAAQVSLPVNITSSNSFETFIDILPFATGATSIAVNTVTNSFSGANPLAPNSELMLRGVPTLAQLRGNNGAAVAVFTASSYIYVRNVGQCFALPPGGMGTFMQAGGPNPSLTYPAFGGGDFPVGTPGVAYFTFTNTGTGMTHDGWAEIVVQPGLTPTITRLCVDTGVVPEPTSMGLLCMGAAGVAAFRRRKRELAA